MSTVGYGDLNVEKDPKSRTLYGACYMLFAMVMAILFFGAVAESAFSRFKSPVRKIADKFFTKLSHVIAGRPQQDELLYVTIHRLRIQKLSEIVVNFCFLNFIGIVCARYFVNNHADEEGEYWDWYAGKDQSVFCLLSQSLTLFLLHVTEGRPLSTGRSRQQPVSGKCVIYARRSLKANQMFVMSLQQLGTETCP